MILKRFYYFGFFILALFASACSDDEAAEKPSFLTLEERVVQTTSFSFYLRAEEGAGDGTAHFLILDGSDPAPTVSEIKSNPATISVALAGGGTTTGSSLGLTPNTTYMVYAFMEVGGVEGELVSLGVTTSG